MFDRLVEAISSSAWTYLVVLAVCAADAVLPVLPSETVVITGGVLAGAGDLNLVLVMIAGVAGAFLGDTTNYWLGRRFGPRVAGRLLRGERGKRSLDRAERSLRRRGVLLIVVARFVPGGRRRSHAVGGAALARSRRGPSRAHRLDRELRRRVAGRRHRRSRRAGRVRDRAT